MKRTAIMVWINPDDIVSLFSLWNSKSGFAQLPQLQNCLDDNGNTLAIPDDAKVLDATYDFFRGSIGVRLEHPSFPEWEDGAYCPSARLVSYIIHSRPTEQKHPDSHIVLTDSDEPICTTRQV